MKIDKKQLTTTPYIIVITDFYEKNITCQSTIESFQALPICRLAFWLSISIDMLMLFRKMKIHFSTISIF